MQKLDIGVIGLSVMGRSLALNLCDHGYQVGGFNRSKALTEELSKKWPHENFHPFFELKDLVESLKKPRNVLLMVQAGAAVDAVLTQLFDTLEADDIILDCGNSHFMDTKRRTALATEKSLHYFGVGVSGGEEGARKGPAIMPGGNKTIYEAELKDMFETIAAKAPDGTPCCSYVGPEGAGHFVKMVHNGIEYADMQLIAEAYLLLKQAGGYDNHALSEIFSAWNQSELESYLMEITADILREPDDHSQGELLDMIEDSAGQKGTGRWTSIEALQLGVDVSIITAAGNARITSNNLELRTSTAQLIKGPESLTVKEEKECIDQVRKALYTAKILAYAQGFSMMQRASDEYGWELKLEDIAGIFRGGCIIRAVFLDEISKAYRGKQGLLHLTHGQFFSEKLIENQEAFRQTVEAGVRNGVPMPAFANAISFFDALRGAPLGANLLQAQRDYFGAHTYKRIDRAGVYHHEWGHYHE